MRRKSLLVLFICLFGLGSRLARAEWYPGIIHAHSTFSDGDRTPEMLMEEAAKASCLFLIVTDHYEQIDKEEKIGAKFAEDFGFDNYRKRFQAVPTIGSIAVPLVVIPGAEITTYWNGACSHALVLGNLARRDEKLFALQAREGTQQAVIDRLNELRLLAAAAHPMLVSLKYKEWYGEISNFQFDPGKAKGLRGIEFFNDETAKGYKRTLNWYLSLLCRGDNIFVTSGCDSHTSLEPGDSNRWERKTWVWTKELNQAALLEAIAQGQTYAANFGASLESLNYTPGFKVQEVDRAEFQFTVVFEKETTGSKTVQIYRDGILLTESIRQYPKGFKRIEYTFKDNEVRTGRHWYVVEVEGVLITSPIVFEVKKPSTSRLGKILFCLEDENGQVALWMINPDGSGLRKWINWDRDDIGPPSFSPDGKEMVFCRKIAKENSLFSYAIFLKSFESGTLKQICPSGTLFPSWSSDGKKIVFIRYWDYRTEAGQNVIGSSIWTMDKDGKNQKEEISKDLAKQVAYADIEDPHWSPDGKQIAFRGICDLFIANADGSNIRRLTRDLPQWTSQGPFLWSPTGDRIGFLSAVIAENVRLKKEDIEIWKDVHTILPNGRGRKIVISDLRYTWDFDWSKTGREVVLSVGPSDPPWSGNFDKYRLIVINIDKPTQRRTIFTRTNCKIHWVMWSSFHANF